MPLQRRCAAAESSECRLLQRLVISIWNVTMQNDERTKSTAKLPSNSETFTLPDQLRDHQTTIGQRKRLLRRSDRQAVTVESEQPQLVSAPCWVSGKIDRRDEAPRTIHTNRTAISDQPVEQSSPICITPWHLTIRLHKKEHDPSGRRQHHAPVR